jgi:hypothetical protein
MYQTTIAGITAVNPIIQIEILASNAVTTHTILAYYHYQFHATAIHQWKHAAATTTQERRTVAPGSRIQIEYPPSWHGSEKSPAYHVTLQGSSEKDVDGSE